MFFTKLRLRYGMFWKGTSPPLKRPIFLLFVLVLLSSLYYFTNATVMSLAHAEGKIAELTDYEKLFFDCLNNKTVMTYDNNSGKGFGKTAIVCKIEEIPV